MRVRLVARLCVCVVACVFVCVFVCVMCVLVRANLVVVVVVGLCN